LKPEFKSGFDLEEAYRRVVDRWRHGWHLEQGRLRLAKRALPVDVESFRDAQNMI
jgi:hypothetical protein